MDAPQVMPAAAHLSQQRGKLLRHIKALLDGPMTVLAFVWLGLLVVDFTRGLSPVLQIVNNVLWGLFGAHFALEFLVAPQKGLYLRQNWLTALALLLPAVRVLRIFRAFRFLGAARAGRSVGLLRVLTSLNRGMRATQRALRRRGVLYVATFTILVIFAGAAGMYQFENPAALREAGDTEAVEHSLGLSSYGESVWWTTMIMTTMGTDYWPRTPEGRILCGLLALYAFAVFGYITAALASFFVGQDRTAAPSPDTAAQQTAATELQAEMSSLRVEIQRLRTNLDTLQHTH